VSVIGTAVNPPAVINTIGIGLGSGSTGVAITPDGKKAYVTNANPNVNTVSVIDTATDTITDTISVAGGPSSFGIFITPSTTMQTAPPSGTACNGVYNGTFIGDVTVSTGQNCKFINGGQIVGNVNVTGGNFGLTNATLDGNLWDNCAHVILVQATINGTVEMVPVVDTSGAFCAAEGPPAHYAASSLLASSSVSSSICGTTISKNLEVDSNGTAVAVQIGSSSPLICPGNRIGGNFEANYNTGSVLIFNNTVTGNMSVDNNSGPLDVVGNKVGGTLQCQNNSNLIMGGGNTAKKKQGQCN
jgi:YVTN family beta-propeller protein